MFGTTDKNKPYHRCTAIRPDNVGSSAPGHPPTYAVREERILCALRVDLMGGIERLAEALANGAADADPDRLSLLAKVFGPRGLAAERRLGSLAQVLDLPLRLAPTVGPRQPMVRLDPRDERVVWVDDTVRVAWNITADELRAVAGN